MSPSPSAPPFQPSSQPIVLITGGHSGIGFYASTHLALKGFKVLIASRSASKVHQAIDQIENDHPAELKGKGRLKHVQLDLTDLKSVRGCVAEVEGGEGRLDVLINNACLHGGGTPYLLLPNGIEQMVCTNFVGPALLTKLFLPLLDKTAKKGGDVRILNVTSDQHTAAPKNLHFTSLEDFNRAYSKNPSGMAGCRVRYGTTKLLLNLLTTHLTSTLLPLLSLSSSSSPPSQSIVALSLDPGWTLTPSSVSTVPSFFAPLLKLFLAPLEKGGEVLVWGATNEAVRTGGSGLGGKEGEGGGKGGKGMAGSMVGREGKVVKETGIGGIGEEERERAGEVWKALEERVWEGR